MPINYQDRKTRVFVSSTSADLKEYRAVARLVISGMGWDPEMMEDFGAMSYPTVEACYEKLGKCDLMVLIVAFRQGWVPTVEQGGNGRDSITALELEFARKRGIPVLAFRAKETWPGNLWDDDATARAWIKKFRDELNQPAGFFDYEAATVDESERFPAFRAILRTTLVAHREQIIKNSPPAVSAAGLDQLESASAALRLGRCIPFLGQGIYGDGPLSTSSFIQMLGDMSCQEPCLATAAEYRERFVRSREGFLSHLEKIIGEQASHAAAPSVHDLLLRIKPPLIVSTTDDLLLEQRLDAEGKRPLILCHVMRSRDGEHDGKVLMFHGPSDDKPKLYPADKIDLSAVKDTYVIYKPLGSPLLHRQLDPEMEIDTVVITEADHLVLLSRLENQSTRVPTAFSRYFQRYPLIFLGYPMDVWHYRLVVQVFQSIGMTTGKSSGLAVRVAASRLEELSWHRLGVDLLPMDPNAFARKVMETL